MNNSIYPPILAPWSKNTIVEHLFLRKRTNQKFVSDVKASLFIEEWEKQLLGKKFWNSCFNLRINIRHSFIAQRTNFNKKACLILTVQENTTQNYGEHHLKVELNEIFIFER